MDLSQNNMKPLFCVDITADKNNETFNGAEFIVRTTSKQKLEEYRNKQNDLEETIEKSKLPLWLFIAKYICGLFSLIVIGSMFKVGFETSMRNAPFLIISGFLCGIVWIILQFFSKKKEKKVLKEENAEGQVEDLTEGLDIIYDDLDIPDNAEDIDILLFRYKIKNGKICPHTPILQSTPYVNPEVKIYVADERINIVDIECVYSFKKEEIKSITRVNKRISVPMWNKEEDPRKGDFKRFKMTVNNGIVYFKPYYILDIERDGQRFGIYFPCYELEVIERLTGLSAQEQQSTGNN